MATITLKTAETITEGISRMSSEFWPPLCDALNLAYPEFRWTYSIPEGCFAYQTIEVARSTPKPA